MNHDSGSRLPGERMFTLLLCAFSLGAFYKAHDIDGFSALSSAGAFPLAVTATMVIASALILLRTFRLPARLPRPAWREILPPNVIFMVGMMAAYIVMLQQLGFLPTSQNILLVTIKALWGKGALVTLATSLLVLVAIYLVFRIVFSVLMPEGIVPEREIIAWVRTLFGSGGR
ncbi:MAG: tripartite tricarboxylate transporter TctB family protein [Rhodospirillales bacterium]